MQIRNDDRLGDYAVVESTAELPVVLLYGIDPSWSETDREEATRETRRLGSAMRRQGHSVSLLRIEDQDLRGVLAEYHPRDVLIFNWCEGMPGIARSEALVAETLEKLRFTYTGATAKALRLSYDKPRVKRRLESRGVVTPRWKVLQTPKANGWTFFPAIVKPACEHCSVGVDAGAVVSSPKELEERAAYVLEALGQPALVEDFIDGREFHVSLWGNEAVEMLPPVEMDFSSFDDIHQRLCSHEAKFSPDSEAYQKIKTYVPARLSEAETGRLEAACRAAYQAVDCRDYGRIDVRLKDDVFYVIDVNPNADISIDASLALAAGKAGYCYGRLGSRVLEFAAQRHAQNSAPHQ